MASKPRTPGLLRAASRSWLPPPLLAAVLLVASPAAAQVGTSPPTEPTPTTVFLVRHAEDLDTPGDPPLTPAGEARARALADALSGAGVDVIYSTHFQRTRGTAAPLARRLGIDVRAEEVAPGGTATWARALAERIRSEHAGQTVLVVGHSNTTPLLARLLGGDNLPPLEEADFDNLFVVTLPALGAPRTLRLTYGAADGVPAPPSAERGAKARRIHDFLSEYHRAGLLNGSVLVADSGRVIYEAGFGEADMEWGVPNAPDTRFRVGSVTKQFTAALILLLREEGKVRLEGTIRDYLPDYPPEPGGGVTIHQLLTHTSGIPSYTDLPGFMQDQVRDPYAPGDFLAVFDTLPLEFEPGSRWAYNNSAYFLLGAIIERVEGRRYDEVLRERILEPLGMEDTGYDHFGRLLERRAEGYLRTYHGFENAPYLDTSVPYSAGMLYSTVRDLHRWDRALVEGRVFRDPGSAELMFTGHADTGSPRGRYGYGWFIGELPLGPGGERVPVVWHGGGIFGFIAAYWRMPEDGRAIVVLDNTTNPRVGEVARNLARILYGAEPESPKLDVAQAIYDSIEARGPDAAREAYAALRERASDRYDFSEPQLNRLGYHYLEKGEVEAALAAFALNAEVYPESANVWDSLAEATLEAGNREEAIRLYRRSLALDPDNEHARQVLRELGAEP